MTRSEAGGPPEGGPASPGRPMVILARVHITPRRGVLDPQGKATRHGLGELGFEGVEEVRVGKYIEIRLEGVSKEEAEGRVRSMCERLLANPNTEDFTFEIGHP